MSYVNFITRVFDHGVIPIRWIDKKHWHSWSIFIRLKSCLSIKGTLKKLALALGSRRLGRKDSEFISGYR